MPYHIQAGIVSMLCRHGVFAHHPNGALPLRQTCDVPVLG